MMGILVSGAGAARLELKLAPLSAAPEKRELSTSRRLTQPSICARICLAGSNQKRTSTKQILLYPDGNFVRNDRWVERIMLSIAQHQLESVFARRQIDTCLGLTRSVMKMGLVLRDWFIEIERFIHIN